MTLEWWFDFIQRAGGVAAVLELGALLWMNVDRKRLLDALEVKDKQLSDLSERTMVLLAELKTFLFHGGRPS